MKYWFKPKRFWHKFAFYYPTSFAGWIATLTIINLGVMTFALSDADSHSGSDTLIKFAPYAIALLITFDLLCFQFGEYPHWWRKGDKNVCDVGDDLKGD
jgi:hypothetical protein